MVEFRAVVAASVAAGLLAAMPVASSAATEELMTSYMPADFELDSARDGTYCASCNFGEGNARVTYVDQQNNLWVAPIDVASGRMLTDQAYLVDTNAAFVTDYGNGPSWMFSQRGSELVYTRYLNGRPHRDGSAGVAMARQTGFRQWQAGFIPGGMARVSPKATTEETDPVPRISYGDVNKPLGYWRFAESNAVEQVLPGDGSNRGIGLRFVPGSPEIVYGFTPPGEVDNQIFVYNMDTGANEQITTGTGYKRGQFMLYAPEFGGQAIAFMVVDDTRFDLYKGVVSGGIRNWVKFDTINMPAAQAYISGSPEAFVFNGRTWILLALRKTTGLNVPSNLAIQSLDTSRNELRMLTDQPANPTRWRSDPEYFITPDTVYIYYTRALPFKFPTVGEGVWRVDTGLGPK